MQEPNDHDFLAIQRTLDAFDETLQSEHASLRALAYRDIDRSTRRKLELQEQLDQQLAAYREQLPSLAQEKIKTLQDSLDRCRRQAKTNDALIQAFSSHIQTLQTRLSGTTTHSYAPAHRARTAYSNTQAVLTDSVG